MMHEEMTREELMPMVYNLECDSCESCPFREICEHYELF